MLRKLHSTIVEKFRSVDHGVHQKVLTFFHMAHFVPSKNLIRRETVSVLHDFLAGRSLFLIDKIADQKIYCFRSTCQLIKSLKDLIICILIYPVITVNNLEIETCGITDSGIYRLSVSSVLLMDCLDNGRIFCCIIVCDLSGTVAGAVIYDDDLHFLSSDQQGIDTF